MQCLQEGIGLGFAHIYGGDSAMGAGRTVPRARSKRQHTHDVALTIITRDQWQGEAVGADLISPSVQAAKSSRKV